MSTRGRKPSGHKALTNAERQRRYRERHAQTRPKPSRGSIEEQALQNVWGRRAVHFVLANIRTQLAEALANRPEGVPDKRGLILGHQIGVGHAMAIVDHHIDWVKPTARARYVAE